MTCRSMRSGRSVAIGCSSSSPARARPEPPRSAAPGSRTRSTSRSRSSVGPGSTACRAPSAGTTERWAPTPWPPTRRRPIPRRGWPDVCGVIGVALPPGSGTEAAAVAATGLFALQHRGQESAGVAVSDGAEIFLYKDLGMIAQVLDDRRLPGFRGDMAIAHCRYSTTGSTIWENAQPTFRLGPRRPVAIGHNGNLVNTRELLEQLEGGRARLAATTDTELLTTLLADEPAPDTIQALLQLLPRVRGAYSLLVLDRTRIIGIRDPHGFRPLVLGRIPEVATGTGDA